MDLQSVVTTRRQMHEMDRILMLSAMVREYQSAKLRHSAEPKSFLDQNSRLAMSL